MCTRSLACHICKNKQYNMTAVTITQITPHELEMLIESILMKSISEWVTPQKNLKQSTHFTKREASSELSCSIPMIDKLIQQGRLDKVKVGAKVLIPREGIERILNNKKGSANAK